MVSSIMARNIQLKRNTAANLASANNKLAIAEVAYETDTNKVKVGDGGTAYNSIRYSVIIDNATQTLTDKTFVGSNNNFTNIPNSSLINNTISLNGISTALGSSVSIGGLTPVAVNSNITLAKNYRYFIDTTASRNLTLPASVAQGDEIHLFDASSNAGSGVFINILSNGNKINGVVQDLTLNVTNFRTVLIYMGSNYGWKVI